MSEPTQPPWESSFRHRMKALRDRQGRTQAELATLATAAGLAFHQQTIQRIESGARPLRLNEAGVIADALGAKLTDMMRPETAESAREELERNLRSLVGISQIYGNPFAMEANEVDAYLSDAISARDHYLEVCKQLNVSHDAAVMSRFDEDTAFADEVLALLVKASGWWQGASEAYPGKAEERGWSFSRPYGLKTGESDV